MFSRRVALACAVVPTSLLARPARAAPGSVVTDIAGVFKYAGGKRERDRFRGAVEDVVAGLNMLLRPIARGKLLESQAPAPTLTVGLEGAMATVQRAGKPAVRAQIDGPATKWKNQYGGLFKIRMRAKNERTLALTFDGTSSHSESTYGLSKDGKTLTLRTKIADPRLPKSLAFSYTYRRG